MNIKKSLFISISTLIILIFSITAFAENGEGSNQGSDNEFHSKMHVEGGYQAPEMESTSPKTIGTEKISTNEDSKTEKASLNVKEAAPSNEEPKEKEKEKPFMTPIPIIVLISAVGITTYVIKNSSKSEEVNNKLCGKEEICLGAFKWER